MLCECERKAPIAKNKRFMGTLITFAKINFEDSEKKC